MKAYQKNASLLILCTTLLAACATDDPNRRTKTGAAIGAVAGGILGHQANSSTGRYAGAVIGAITGAAVGNYMDNQQKQLEEELKEERRHQKITITRIDDETLKLNVRSEASFDINSATIQANFKDSLDTMAEIIEEYDKTAIHVIGHTDSTGSHSYNQQLSEKRAASVTRYLSRNGVQRSRMRYSGRGETLPVADNTTSSGRSQNRRVEIYLKTFVEGRESDALKAPI